MFSGILINLAFSCRTSCRSLLRAAMPSPSPSPVRPPRLHSLDALRGLDMLIILGLDALVLLLASRNPESAFLQEAGRQQKMKGRQKKR